MASSPPHSPSTSSQPDQELLQAKQALERKTEELAHSLALMQATLEATTDGIFAVDKNFRISAYNENLVRMWGVPREVMETLEQRQLARIVSSHMQDPEHFKRRVDAIYETSPKETFDILELKDGRTIERFSKMQLVAGENVGRVWTFRDITERRRAEEGLREETRVLEVLNNTGKLLIGTFDQSRLIRILTEAAVRLSGAAAGAFFHAPPVPAGSAPTLHTPPGVPQQLFAPFGQAYGTTLLAPLFEQGQAIRCSDLRADATYRSLLPDPFPASAPPALRSYLAMPVRAHADQVIGALLLSHPDSAIFTDKTERLLFGLAAQAAIALDNARLYEEAQRTAEERKILLANERAARTQAEQMSEIKDEFLATLSHELRTPLSAILGWSQLLRRDNLTAADLRKGLDTIERNARAQVQLMEDLLDMSRITSDKVRLDTQVIEPISFIEAAIEAVRPAAQAKDIHLDLQLDPATGPIVGDPGRLQQVIWNLLSNAIKFTPAGGSVCCQLERSSAHIDISISDTGVGIRQDFLDQVFDRFRQADGSTTRKYGGLGIGLSIVKSLIELHGGSVQAKSAGEGQGATFTLRLPRTSTQRNQRSAVQLPTHTQIASPTPFQKANLAGLKILVVDDEVDARELIERVLAECEATVLAAGSAREALPLVERERPDVLISDISMPEVDGYELLQRIRALGADRGGSLPAIALTAFARSEDRTRALHAGFLVHVAKPVEPSELAATVASVAGRTGG